jgi:protease-4
MRYKITLILTGVLLPFLSALGWQKSHQKVNLAVIELSGELTKEAHKGKFGLRRSPRFYQFLSQLRKAKSDKRIEGILLRIFPIKAGFSKIQELRTHLEEFKRSGKKVYCSFGFISTKEYLLASVADRINILPCGMLWLTGLSAELTYLKGLFDKLGIEFEEIALGKYKSAGTLSRKSSTDAIREVVNSLLDELYDQLIRMISSSRKLKKEELVKILDRAPFTAEDALKEGLVDSVSQEDAFLRTLERSYGKKIQLVEGYGLPRPTKIDLSPLGFLKFLRSLLAPRKEKLDLPRIAIIHIEGIILDYVPPFPQNLFLSNYITPAEIKIAVEEILKDKSIKGVVIRVNSPGGSVLASNQILHMLQKLGREKPIISSLSEVAASGGYWVCLASDIILAEPATITGSIGVLGIHLNLEKMYEKLGIKKEIFKRGRFADFLSPSRALKKQERKKLKSLLKSYYNKFVELVAQRRVKSLYDVQKIARGRVYTGSQAKDNGLIDRIGGLNKAIELLKTRAGIKPSESVLLEHFPRPQPPLKAISRFLSKLEDLPLQALLIESLPYLLLDKRGVPLAIWPYKLKID